MGTGKLVRANGVVSLAIRTRLGSQTSYLPGSLLRLQFNAPLRRPSIWCSKISWIRLVFLGCNRYLMILLCHPYSMRNSEPVLRPVEITSLTYKGWDNPTSHPIRANERLARTSLPSTGRSCLAAIEFHANSACVLALNARINVHQEMQNCPRR